MDSESTLTPQAGSSEHSKKRSRSELAQYAAKHKRINRQHPRKSYVLFAWHDWRANKDLYKNQSALIDNMLEEGVVERRETIRRWIKEFEQAFKTEHSLDEYLAFMLQEK